ncbi:MAG: amidohydrolase family protein, partial [Chloroflexota bacterium]
VAALERALQRYPNTKVIWAHQNPIKTSGGSTAAHARKADPQQIAALLDKYPNLFADISVGYETGFRTDNDRQLPENWRGLYEKYNDRFVIGLDRASNEAFEQGYVYWAFWMRGWLAQLSEGARRNIAYENIERILAARPSPGQTCQYLTK